MGSQVWVGAAVTLIGVALGGAISLLLNRQQMKDAWAQRAEEAKRDRYRRSVDRRFQAYSDFITRARAYRNVVGDYCRTSGDKPTIGDIDAFMRSANDASALVFLVVESVGTYDACRAVLNALGKTKQALHDIDSSSTDDPWPGLNDTMGHALRDFQIAAREELGVGGMAEQWVMHSSIPDGKSKSGADISDP